MPARDHVVMSEVIARHAAERPDAPCAVDIDGSRWTWRDALAEMDRAAASLHAVGVRRREFVGVMLPNGFDWLRAWWGLNRLGATLVAINPALRGATLEHVCRDSGITRVVVNEELADRIAALDVDVELVDPVRLRSADGPPPALDAPIDLWDVAAVGYTSGTTGPSKGVLQTHLHMWFAAPSSEWAMTADDVMLMCNPLFHTGGWAPAMASWLVGGSVALRSHFRASTWLDDIRDTQATITLVLGTMASLLLADPEEPDDATTSLQRAVVVPFPKDPNAFMARFGLEEAYVMYGMTELPQALGWTWRKVEKPASSGKVRAGYEIRLVDEHDIPVPDGQAGQLVVRADRPWQVVFAYLNRPDATAEAWRNGWFHTGDHFTRDEEGFYYFVDRATDSLRRRGENISSFEVEREVMAHPDVAEAACIGVAGDVAGDQEVKVFVVEAAGRTLDPAQLVEFLVGRMPYFTIPRYVEVVTELPKTPSSRVQKYLLRERPTTAATWDRVAAGIDVARDY